MPSRGVRSVVIIRARRRGEMMTRRIATRRRSICSEQEICLYLRSRRLRRSSARITPVIGGCEFSPIARPSITIDIFTPAASLHARELHHHHAVNARALSLLADCIVWKCSVVTHIRPVTFERLTTEDSTGRGRTAM